MRKNKKMKNDTIGKGRALNMRVRIALLFFVTVSIVSSTVLSGQRRRAGEAREPIDTTQPHVAITGFFPDPMLPTTFEALIARSDLIVEGIVTNILGSYLNGPDRMGLINTDSEISIRSVLKTTGSRNRGRVTVRLFGGKVGELHEIVETQPPFVVGEEYVLFLERVSDAPSEVYYPIGFSRGRFKIIEGRVYPNILTDSVGKRHVRKDLDLFVDEIVQLIY